MIIGNNCDYLLVKRDLLKNFDTTYLGLLHYYLVFELDHKRKYIFISHKKYISYCIDLKYIGQLFHRFEMPITTMEQSLKLTSIKGSMFQDPTK